MEQNGAGARKRTPAPGGAAQVQPAPLAVKPKVNFAKLDINALKRYLRIHKLAGVPPTATKEQLVAAVTRHFAAQMVNDEVKVITAFVTAVQRRQTLVAQQAARK